MVLEVKIAVPENVYLKDPQQSKLGLQLIQVGIELIEEIGYEAFTFKKLAIKINSTEASVYRYFENKQQFLQFLFSWYWGWMNYKIHMETA
jgi:AcrR family transcriptional regulator